VASDQIHPRVRPVSRRVLETVERAAKGQVENDVHGRTGEPGHEVDCLPGLGLPAKLLHQQVNVRPDERLLPGQRMVGEGVGEHATEAPMIFVFCSYLETRRGSAVGSNKGGGRQCREKTKTRKGERGRLTITATSLIDCEYHVLSFSSPLRFSFVRHAGHSCVSLRVLPFMGPRRLTMNVLICSAGVVRQLVRRDSHNLAVGIVPKFRLVGQVTRKLMIDVMEARSAAKPRSRIRPQRVKVDVVNGFGEQEQNELT
jgi:hypothetical protein